MLSNTSNSVLPDIAGLSVQRSEVNDDASATLNPYHQLFAISEQLVPFLSHQSFTSERTLSARVQDDDTQRNRQLFSDLYKQLRHQHPEAGSRYWAYKCWQLVIWQPVLLSVISVYALKVSLPLSRLKLHCHKDTIAGYQIEVAEHYLGNTQDLISHCASESSRLIEQCFSQLQQVCREQGSRLRKALCQRLLSDQLLEALAQVPRYLPELNEREFNAQVSRWQSSYALSVKDLTLDNNSQLQRSSCCYEYRLTSADYCTNCPKTQARNQQYAQP